MRLRAHDGSCKAMHRSRDTGVGKPTYEDSLQVIDARLVDMFKVQYRYIGSLSMGMHAKAER